MPMAICLSESRRYFTASVFADDRVRSTLPRNCGLVVGCSNATGSLGRNTPTVGAVTRFSVSRFVYSMDAK